jgi:hypothetical protein
VERVILFTNLLTRGYNTKTPSFKTLNYTALSSVVYYIAFTKLVKTSVNNFETTSKLM